MDPEDDIAQLMRDLEPAFRRAAGSAPPAATAAEKKEAASRLQRAIAAVKPALVWAITAFPPTLRGQLPGAIPVRYRYRSPAPDPEFEWYSRKGLCLASDGPRVNDPSRPRGSYQGASLYLLEDGSLAEAEYRGEWNRRILALSEWNAELRVITPREAMERWNVAECLDHLAGALKGLEYVEESLKEAEEGRRTATREALERLEAIRNGAR